MEEQIQQVIQQKVSENFQERDQLLLDLVQGLDHLNELAELSNNTLGPPSLTKKKYPKSLKHTTSPPPPPPSSSSSSSSSSSKNTMTKRSIAVARQRKLEEILDTPHSVHSIKGGWWNIDLRRKKGELKLFQERGVAKGSECISLGKKIKKSRVGITHYNRKFRKDLPKAAEGEEGKYTCDIRMSLDTFCSIFHSKCKEFNLIDAYSRGRVKCTLFGEGDMTGNDIITKFENYLLKKIRGGPVDRMIDSKIDTRINPKLNVDDVKKAITDIFVNIIGTELENVGFWTVVTERIRCNVQFQIKNCTTLISRRNSKVNNIGEISRIRNFRRSGKGVLGVSFDDIMNPKEIPLSIVKREADMEKISLYNNSLKGRRRKRAQDEQTMKLRKIHIEEVCCVVLIGFDPARRKDALIGLQQHTRMSEDDADWALKYGVPYYLLKQKKPEMSLDQGDLLVEQLEKCGCEVLLERQFDFV